MRIRDLSRTSEDKVELHMTPMIDIVFQLLVFFIMTFRIVAYEGDFNVKMPLAQPQQDLPDDIHFPPMKLRLQADSQGNLADIALNERSFGLDFARLQDHVISIVGDDIGPGRESAEVELDVDYNLHYEHVIEAITAVSGFIDRGEIVRLVEKIKFAPPRPDPAAP